MRRREDWEAPPPADIKRVQDVLTHADHIVLFYPLWLGSMPALVYRWFFRAHSLKSLKRNILQSCGIKPVRTSVIGMVEAPASRARDRWLRRMETYGRAAA
jgi:putative NADPH-quinone reductase